LSARCSVVVNHDGGGPRPDGPGRLFVVEHSGPHHCCRELRGHPDSDAVRNEDIDRGTDLVEVEAELQRQGRDDVALESAVSRLSLEPHVTWVSWNVIEETGVPLVSDQ